MMVRYGVYKDRIPRRERNRRNVSTSNEDEDLDEVDNAMSKFNYNEEIRRTSLSSSSQNPQVSEDENDSDSDDDMTTNDVQQNTKTNCKLAWLTWPNFALVFVIVIASLVYLYMYSNNDGRNQNNYDESKFYNDINYLGKKYKIKENSILQIQSVISTTFQKQDTASFIFTYNSDNSKFNPTNFNKFINDIAFTAARFLRNDSDIRNHVIVDSSKLDMQVHGELIERYRNDVTKAGVMLVKDLDEVPSYLAMAFHYYCDEFNPLVKRSAIFFTLNMARCSDHKISHASIEKCLTRKWTIIPKDNIVPLLTRIVNVVIDVTNVF